MSPDAARPRRSGKLDRATGKFTYTRRLFLLTSLNFRVFTSTTLDDWTEDTTATSSVSSTADSVEAVEVTLSAPKPLAGPKFFIRVEAD